MFLETMLVINFLHKISSKSTFFFFFFPLLDLLFPLACINLICRGVEGPCGRTSVPACSVLPVARTCVGFQRSSPSSKFCCSLLSRAPLLPPAACWHRSRVSCLAVQPAVPCPVPLALLLWSKWLGRLSWLWGLSSSPKSSLGEQAPLLGLTSVLPLHPRIFLTLLFYSFLVVNPV